MKEDEDRQRTAPSSIDNVNVPRCAEPSHPGRRSRQPMTTRRQAECCSVEQAHQLSSRALELPTQVGSRMGRRPTATISYQDHRQWNCDMLATTARSSRILRLRVEVGGDRLKALTDDRPAEQHHRGWDKRRRGAPDCGVVPYDRGVGYLDVSTSRQR
jgi:hypothetical protein